MADQGTEGSQPVDLTKHPSGIVPTLQNIVSTVNLDCKLDLKAIALQARNAEYNPKRFAAVIMRIREPKTTALIFASGKMVCFPLSLFLLWPNLPCPCFDVASMLSNIRCVPELKVNIFQSLLQESMLGLFKSLAFLQSSRILRYRTL
jgi:hypothetical protein